MALLHLLRLRADLKVCAAHFEHGLRGEESLRDAAFVEDYCRREGIPCLVEHGDVRAFARENGLGIEEAARELRYAFLERAADALGCDTIATAHNADDNAETLLLHLLRGSGLDGLRGIPPRRGNVIRPLLYMTREEVLAYCEKESLDYVTDSSNLDPAWSRNRIRLRVLPELSSLYGDFAASASRAALLCREDEAFLEGEAEKLLASARVGRDVYLAPLLADAPPALSARALRRAAEEAGGRVPEAEHIRTLRKMLAGGGVRWTLSLPGTAVSRDRDRLSFSVRRPAPPPRVVPPPPFPPPNPPVRPERRVPLPDALEDEVERFADDEKERVLELGEVKVREVEDEAGAR